MPILVMKMIKIFILTAVLFTMATLICPAQNSPRVSALEAKIFYQNTGTFSGDAIAGQIDLWNSPFDSSYSTLVLVKLSDLPPYLRKSLRVELSARYVPFYREKGSLNIRQVEIIRNGTENGLGYAAFWLKNTGCNPVHLTARIVGSWQRPVRETVRFGCGE
jgi:hypothetical protein